MITYLCPVCWSVVKPTTRGNIPAHMTQLCYDSCPAGGEPFRITIPRTPEFQGVVA